MSRSWKQDEHKRHASNLTTRTMRREKNACSKKDFLCFSQHNPGTNTAATRQREDFSGAIPRFRQATSAAVTSGESISAPIPPAGEIWSTCANG